MTSRSNPFEEIERMFDRMSRQFESFDPSEFGMGGAQIAVDVVDEGDAFEVTADLPGFASEDIEVRLTDPTTLHISAETESDVESEADAEAGVFIRRERRRRSASRSVTLPEEVEEDETEANFANGVLTVVLPKREPSEEEGKNIPVE